jgi:hypothetical protein
MKKTSILVVMMLAVAGLSVLSGCKSDPHDTHIATPISAPR